jgi:hypothetical protein
MLKPSENNSRFLLALGGFCGFSLAFFAALGAGSDANHALLRGGVGLLLGLVMMKFFLRVLYDTARSVRETKREAMERAERERRKKAEEAELGLGEDPQSSTE